MHIPNFAAHWGLCGLVSTLLLLTTAVTAKDTKAMYLYKDVLQSNTNMLKTSFNTLIIFRIGILESGDLVYYSTGDNDKPVDAPVVSKGKYIGGKALTNKIRGFKQGKTQVDRIEISLLSNDATFKVIRDRVKKEGVGKDTILYRNFDCLRREWGIDALNNDDETLMDLRSTVEFAKMVGRMGYKYSIAPYDNEDYWKQVVDKINKARNGLVDKVYLQCYDGGAYNDPTLWAKVLGMKIVPIEWVTNKPKPKQGKTPQQCRANFSRWKRTGALNGGAYWNDLDMEKLDKKTYAQYADVLQDIFK